MAGHNGSGSSEKKSRDSTTDIPTFSAENLQSNMKIIYYRFVFILIENIPQLFNFFRMLSYLIAVIGRLLLQLHYLAFTFALYHYM